MLLLRQAAYPRVTELGRVPGTNYFADRVRHSENEQMSGVLIVRSEAALLYFNVDHVRNRVMQLVSGRTDSIRLVIYFLGLVPRIDLAGAEFLEELHRSFAARGIELRLADAHGSVRDALRRHGYERRHSPLEEGQTVETILSRWQAHA